MTRVWLQLPFKYAHAVSQTIFQVSSSPLSAWSNIRPRMLLVPAPSERAPPEPAAPAGHEQPCAPSEEPPPRYLTEDAVPLLEGYDQPGYLLEELQDSLHASRHHSEIYQDAGEPLMWLEPTTNDIVLWQKQPHDSVTTVPHAYRVPSLVRHLVSEVQQYLATQTHEMTAPELLEAPALVVLGMLPPPPIQEAPARARTLEELMAESQTIRGKASVAAIVQPVAQAVESQAQACEDVMCETLDSTLAETRGITEDLRGIKESAEALAEPREKTPRSGVGTTQGGASWASEATPTETREATPSQLAGERMGQGELAGGGSKEADEARQTSPDQGPMKRVPAWPSLRLLTSHEPEVEPEVEMFERAPDLIASAAPAHHEPAKLHRVVREVQAYLSWCRSASDRHEDDLLRRDAVEMPSAPPSTPLQVGEAERDEVWSTVAQASQEAERERDIAVEQDQGLAWRGAEDAAVIRGMIRGIGMPAQGLPPCLCTKIIILLCVCVCVCAS